MQVEELGWLQVEELGGECSSSAGQENNRCFKIFCQTAAIRRHFTQVGVSFFCSECDYRKGSEANIP